MSQNPSEGREEIIMRKRIFACLVTGAVGIMAAMAMAEEPRDLGELVLDGGDVKLYCLHKYGDPTQTGAEGTEVAANGIVRAPLKILQTYTLDDVGMPTPRYALGSSIPFNATFDLLEAGDVTYSFIIRGPNRYRHSLGPLIFEDLSAGQYSVVTWVPDPLPSPGYYKYMIRLRSRGGGTLKGNVNAFIP
jgi:hypothetical protein